MKCALSPSLTRSRALFAPSQNSAGGAATPLRPPRAPGPSDHDPQPGSGRDHRGQGTGSSRGSELLQANRAPEPGMLPEATARAGIGCAVRPWALTWLAWRPTGPAVLLSCGAHPAGVARDSRNRGRSDRGSGGGEVPRRRDSPERSAPAGGRRGGLGRGGARARAGPRRKQRARGGRSASRDRGRGGAKTGGGARERRVKLWLGVGARRGISLSRRNLSRRGGA